MDADAAAATARCPVRGACRRRCGVVPRRRTSARCSTRPARSPSTPNRTSSRRLPPRTGLPFAVFRVIADPRDQRACRPRHRSRSRLRRRRSTGARLLALAAAHAGPAAVADAHRASTRARRLRALSRGRRLPWAGPWLPGSSTSFCSTWRENTYCAGRCCASEISGAIGPSRAHAAQADRQRLQRVAHGILHGGRLVAAMHHAVGALLVIAGAVRVPVRLVHQLAKRLRVAFAEQIAGALPAEDVARRIAPRRALVFLVAGEKIEEQARLAERPRRAAAAALEDVAEQLLGAACGSGNAPGRARARTRSRATR